MVVPFAGVLTVMSQRCHQKSGLFSIPLRFPGLILLPNGLILDDIMISN